MPVVYYYIFLRLGVILRLSKVTAAASVVFPFRAGRFLTIILNPD